MKLKKKKIDCPQCQDETGEFKIYYSREFKKEFGRFKWRKAIERGPYCLNCTHTLFSGGGLAGWFPAYARKAKRARPKYYIVKNRNA